MNFPSKLEAEKIFLKYFKGEKYDEVPNVVIFKSMQWLGISIAISFIYVGILLCAFILNDYDTEFLAENSSVFSLVPTLLGVIFVAWYDFNLNYRSKIQPSFVAYQKTISYQTTIKALMLLLSGLCSILYFTFSTIWFVSFTYPISLVVIIWILIISVRKKDNQFESDKKIQKKREQIVNVSKEADKKEYKEVTDSKINKYNIVDIFYTVIVIALLFLIGNKFFK